MTKPTLDLRYFLERYDWDNAPGELRNLRREVFIEEQGVPPELECDTTDEIAEHFLVRTAAGEMVAVGRLFGDDQGDGRIGRMAVARKARRSGVGLWLLKAIMAHGARQFRGFVLSAQEYAIPFYQRAGFQVCSGTYEDAGIPHRSMRCMAPSLVVNQSPETKYPLNLGHDTTSWQLQTDSDWNEALDCMVSQARQRLWLTEPTLDSGRYDREFLRESLSRLARYSRYSEIRLLIQDDKPLVERHHRMTDLSRRLPSHIHLRLIDPNYPAPVSAFALADDCGVVLRHDARASRGFANFNARSRVRPLAEQFQQLWDRGRRSLELRDMPL